MYFNSSKPCTCGNCSEYYARSKLLYMDNTLIVESAIMVSLFTIHTKIEIGHQGLLT